MTPPTTFAQDSAMPLPDHLHLPEKDGSIVNNFQEHPQSDMLTQSLTPRLLEIFPDKQYAVGCDSGIYWRLTDPPLDGCKAPDWFLVPQVPPMLDGTYRRSYVLWKEAVKPLLVIEYVSGDGSEERDTTPYKGKFWVYEQGISAAFYVIFDAANRSLEVYRLDMGRYQLIEPNAAGRFPIPLLRIEFGIWDGVFREMQLPWLRAWDVDTGALLPMADERADTAEDLLDETREMLDEETERAETERKRADEQMRLADDEKRRADDEKRRAENTAEQASKLREQLRALGIDPAA